MVIVSQLNNSITNFDNVTNIELKECFYRNKSMEYLIVCQLLNKSYVNLGLYKTEKRSKEILQEIIDAYKFNSCEAVGQKNAVYKMPED